MRALPLVLILLLAAFLLGGCGAKVYSRNTVVKPEGQRAGLVTAERKYRYGLYEGGESGELRQLLPPVHGMVKILRGWVYVHLYEAPTLRRYKLIATATGWKLGKVEVLPYTHLGNGVPWLNHTDPSTAVWPYVDPRWAVERVPGFLVKADGPGGFPDKFDWTKPGEAALIVGDEILPLGRLAEAPGSLHGKRWVVMAGEPGKPTSASVLDLDGGLVAGPFTGLQVADTTKGERSFGVIPRKVLIARGAEGGWRPLDAEGRPYQEAGLVEMRLCWYNADWFWEQARDFGHYATVDALGWELTYRADGIERFGFARGDLAMTTGPRYLALEHQRIDYRDPLAPDGNATKALMVQTASGWLPCQLPSTYYAIPEPDEPEPLIPAPIADRAEAIAAASLALEERAIARKQFKEEQSADAARRFNDALARRDRDAASKELWEVGGSAYAKFYLTFGGTEADFTDALTRTYDPELIAKVHARLAEMKAEAEARREADEAARVAERERWKTQRAAELRAEASRAAAEFDAMMNGASMNGAGFDINKSDTGWFSRRAVIRDRIQSGESTYAGEMNAYIRTRMGEDRYLAWKALPAP